MISMFTTFRSFEIPEYKRIQEAALNNWLGLTPQPEIIVLGDSPGSKEICSHYDLKFIPNLNCAKSGAPYIDDYIEKAESNASHDIMLMLSSDMIISNNTYQVLEAVGSFDKFCVCARKKHIEIDEKGEIIPLGWATWQAGDYFLYSKGVFRGIPKFIIGRRLVDNWLYRRAIQQNCMINASYVATVLHLLHSHGADIGEELRLEEIAQNKKIYHQNPVSMPQWKDKVWHDAIGTEIRFANFNMKSDFSITLNKGPLNKKDILLP